MTLRELQYEVEKGEGLHIEFKRKLPEWDKLLREVIAFANTQGGTIFIGVADHGEIFGTKDPTEIEEALRLNLPLYCRPLPTFRIETIPLNRKRAVVCVHVPPGNQKPYLALKTPESSKGTALIRIADSSTIASQEVYEMLKYEGKERNMRVEYGDKEKLLMQYLNEHPFITVEEYSKVAGIPRHIASRTLVHLVKANVLHIQAQLGDDQFLPAFG